MRLGILFVWFNILVLVHTSIAFLDDYSIYNELPELREQVKEMYYHAYNNYMKHAWPADELKPVSCEPRWRLEGPNQPLPRGDVDTAMGRFQLTLIDSIDTLYVMDEKEEWRSSLRKFIETVSFDADVQVSVFETNIRVLGGLLSNYLFCIDEGMMEEAQRLLDFSIDLANRLLPAFNTPTGIPLSKVYLKSGSVEDQPQDNCVACAGTFLLEFGLLSRLTGNSTFENSARKALDSLVRAGLSVQTIGSQIDIKNAAWTQPLSSIGASVDSFFEYLAKSYIFFGDSVLFDWFTSYYTKAMDNVRIGDWYLQSNIHTGKNAGTWTDSLSAFWPGMQVLLGDLEHARLTFKKYWALWQLNGIGLPERYDVHHKKVVMPYYHLRPELIESAYMLYHATEDPYYLRVGKEIVHSLNKYARVPCGFAGLENVITKKLDNDLDSFFLSETCKYLYLLFTPNHTMNRENYIFTTEAHPFRMSQHWRFKLDGSSYLQDGIKQSFSKISLQNYTCLNQPKCRETFLPGSTIYNTKKSSTRNTSSATNVTSTQPQSMITSQTCSFTNSLYRKAINETSESQNHKMMLHFYLDGFKPEWIKHVGAHLLTSDREYIVHTLHPNGTAHGSMYAIRADFGSIINYGNPLISPVSLSAPEDACSPLPPHSLNGTTAIVDRGSCTFAEKALNIENAGGIAAIFVNNLDTAVFTMSDDKVNRSPVKIPLVLISKKDGSKLKSLMHSESQMLISIDAVHPSSPDGILQFVLQFAPNAPMDQLPPIGFQSGNRAFWYGDGLALIAGDPRDQAFTKELTGAQFQVFSENPNAPINLRLFRGP